VIPGGRGWGEEKLEWLRSFIFPDFVAQIQRARTLLSPPSQQRFLGAS
jgi:hypothetical protein